MLRFLTIRTSALAVCCLVVNFTGCAHVFNNSIDDLVPTPATQRKIDSRYDEFSDLTRDPLFNRSATRPKTASGSAESAEPAKNSDRGTENEIQSLDQIESPRNLPASPLSPETGAISNQLDAVPVHDPDQPVHDPQNATIILKAIQKEQEQPILEVENLTELPPPSQELKAVSLPQPTDDFQPDMDQAHSSAPIPVNEVPAQFTGDENNFAPKSDLQPESKSEQLAAFVSSQMQNLIPPFVNHPMESMCIDDYCFVHKSTSTSLPPMIAEPQEPEMEPVVLVSPDKHPLGKPDNAIDSATTIETPAFEEIEEGNFFVGQLIASAADPDTSPIIDTQSANLPAEPVGTLVKTPKEPAPATPPWQGQLEKTIEVFEQEIEFADSADTENLETGLTLLKALQTSLDPTSDTPEELRKFWMHQIEAINELLKTSSDESSQMAASTALEQLHRAVHELQAIAQLTISSVAFCNKVSGFGQYTPFSETDFGPRQSVLVYCEIENFAPLLETADGVTTYQTRLSSSYWIKDSEGVIVQQQDFPVVTDNARNLRRDFYMHLPVTFADLKPGSYTLQVEIRDHGSEKTATLNQALEFTIH